MAQSTKTRKSTSTGKRSGPVEPQQLQRPGEELGHAGEELG